MSIQSEIDRINGNVASTYSALSEMGATMPAQQNSDNLPGTVRTVPQGGGTSVQADWNQTDETAADFIKNKTHYKKVENAELLSYTKTEYDEESGSFKAVLSAPMTVGANYSVNYNGTTYRCKAYDLMGMGVALGNGSSVGMDDTGEPFCIAAIDYGTMIAIIVLDGATEIFLGITGELVTIKRLDTEFSPYTVFYRGEDIYLYKDAGLTEKLTYYELNVAKNSGAPVYIRYGSSSLESPSYISETIGSNSDGSAYLYSDVYLVNGFYNGQFQYKNYCTAEYTPET